MLRRWKNVSSRKPVAERVSWCYLHVHMLRRTAGLAVWELQKTRSEHRCRGRSPSARSHRRLWPVQRKRSEKTEHPLSNWMFEAGVARRRTESIKEVRKMKISKTWHCPNSKTTSRRNTWCYYSNRSWLLPCKGFLHSHNLVPCHQTVPFQMCFWLNVLAIMLKKNKTKHELSSSTNLAASSRLHSFKSTPLVNVLHFIPIFFCNIVCLAIDFFLHKESKKCVVTAFNWMSSLS